MSVGSYDQNQLHFLWGFHNVYKSDVENLKRQEAKLIANIGWTALFFPFIGKELFFPPLFWLPGTRLQKRGLFWFIMESSFWLEFSSVPQKSLYDSASTIN